MKGLPLDRLERVAAWTIASGSDQTLWNAEEIAAFSFSRQATSVASTKASTFLPASRRTGHLPADKPAQPVAKSADAPSTKGLDWPDSDGTYSRL
jgi:hypothetical protein